MMGSTRHLHDDRLHDCYVASRFGDTLDPRAAVHLADCVYCAARYRELSHLLDTTAREGEAEADEIFTGERLQHQHDAILRRLDASLRPARVISFPGHAVAPQQPTTRVATRWVAVAAAAGLFVGVAVGGAMIPRASQRDVGAALTSPPPARLAAAPPVRISAPPADDDDRFLRELEIALQRPHTRELLSFDSLTPYAREIGSRVR